LSFGSCLLDGLIHSPLSFSASLLVVISSREFLVSLHAALSLSVVFWKRILYGTNVLSLAVTLASL